MASTAYQVVFSQFANVAAVAAQNSIAQLLAPNLQTPLSQTLGIWVSLATAGDVIVASYDTALATLDGAGNPTVPPLANHSQTVVRHGTNAALLGTQLKRVSLPAGQSLNIIIPFEFAINLAHGLIVEAVTVNVAMICSFLWQDNFG
jgi:hypothetical protein